MDIFEQTNFECELGLLKLSHLFESVMDSFYIDCEEIRISPVIEESAKGLLYQEANNDIKGKVNHIFQKIIDTIREFIEKMENAIVDFFSEKERKEKISAIMDIIGKNPDKANKQVEIHDDTKNKEALDEYIREMVKLERKLMNIKLQATDGFKNNNKKDTTLIISANEIMYEMNRLNDKYDKKLLNDNDTLIKMALKDAVRFSDKQIENVKVDYNAIQKESERVLAEFKKDANGCDQPVKYNLIQKMANAVGTRVRKFVQKKTEVKKKNLGLIFASAAAILGTSAVAAYNNNPAVKANVDNALKQVGADKAIQKVKDKANDMITNLGVNAQP